MLYANGQPINPIDAARDYPISAVTLVVVASLYLQRTAGFTGIGGVAQGCTGANNAPVPKT